MISIMGMDFTNEQMFLLVMWSILAFVIQPIYILKRLSLKYRDENWIKRTLTPSQNLLMERLNNDYTPTIERILSNHLQTFRASLFKPIMAEAGQLNSDIENALPQSTQMAMIQNDAMHRVAERYPTIGAILPYLIQGNNGHGAGSFSPISGQHHDF